MNCLLFMTYAYLRLVVTLFVTSANENLIAELVTDNRQLSDCELSFLDLFRQFDAGEREPIG
jgi:hypothetical protein